MIKPFILDNILIHTKHIIAPSYLTFSPNWCDFMSNFVIHHPIWLMFVLSLQQQHWVCSKSMMIPVSGYSAWKSWAVISCLGNAKYWARCFDLCMKGLQINQWLSNFPQLAWLILPISTKALCCQVQSLALWRMAFCLTESKQMLHLLEHWSRGHCSSWE
jgi:hypothetical protein